MAIDSVGEWMALLILALDLVAIAHTWSQHIGLGRKIVWSIAILVLPVVGLVMWALAAGPYGKVRL